MAAIQETLKNFFTPAGGKYVISYCITLGIPLTVTGLVPIIPPIALYNCISCNTLAATS